MQYCFNGMFVYIFPSNSIILYLYEVWCILCYPTVLVNCSYCFGKKHNVQRINCGVRVGVTFFSIFITMSSLFIDDQKLTKDARDHLVQNGMKVDIQEYEAVQQFLADLYPEGTDTGKTWVINFSSVSMKLLHTNNTVHTFIVLSQTVISKCHYYFYYFFSDQPKVQLCAGQLHSPGMCADMEDVWFCLVPFVSI